VRTYDYSAWFDRLEEGDFDLSMGWSNEGPTPYNFYHWLMATSTVRPLHVAAIGNWQRYGSKRADALLAQFENEADLRKQHALADDLQRVFADEAPAIPLYANPSWAEFNTRRFTGFPTAQDPFSDASPNRVPECLLVLTSLKPRAVP
jgi:peptide/nickel transport system substrate-binding protein